MLAWVLFFAAIPATSTGMAVVLFHVQPLWLLLWSALRGQERISRQRVAAVLLWVWPLQHGWPASGASWLWLAGLGLAHTALAYMLIYAGMARLPTSRVALLQYLYPAVALLIEGCCWASAWMAGNGWAWASSPAPWSGPNGRPRASPYLQQGA